MTGSVRHELASLARKRWFRAAVAALFLVVHFAAMIGFGRNRMPLPWNRAPGSPPALVDVKAPLRTDDPSRWNRLLAARWDSQHYMEIALRGYSNCPKQDLRTADLVNKAYYCGFNFYPAYGLIGRAASLAGRIPIDYAMLGVSVLASFLFLYLWTGPLVEKAMGIGGAYLSLLLFNAFPSGFTLITILTEPCVLAMTLGALVALGRKQYVLGAVLAGAATGMRVTGAATGAAFGVALLASLVDDRPKGATAWASRALAMALCGWGLCLMMGYYLAEYQDPLLYVHAHKQTYSFLETTDPARRFNAAFFIRTVTQPGHEGAWIFVCVLWLAFGLRRALAGFALVPRVYLYALTFIALGLAVYGAAPIGFPGMNRYWLLVIPLFFAMAQVFQRRYLALGVWLWACLFSYWNVDLCDYVAMGDATEVCQYGK